MSHARTPEKEDIQREQPSEMIHRSTVYFKAFDWHNKEHLGRGTFISSNLVLTAAQNTYDRLSGGQYIRFQSCINANERARQVYEIESIRYPQEYRKCAQGLELQFNYALMKIKKPIELDFYFPLSLLCQACFQKMNNQLLYLYGLGLPWTYQNFNNLNQLHEREVSESKEDYFGDIIMKLIISNFKIAYNINPLYRQIGSPVIISRSIIAIHTGGDARFSCGRVVDEAVIENLIKWQKQMKGQPFRLEYQTCQHKKKVAQTQLNMCCFNMKPIDLGGYESIVKLNLYKNCLEQLDLSPCPNLCQANLMNNQLRFVNTSSNYHLSKLLLAYNNIEKIDLSLNTNLSYLSLGQNRIASIDLSKNALLQTLMVDRNQLTSIDLTSNKELNYLHLRQNRITLIDLSNNKKLTYLCLQQNKLTRLDLSNQPHLQYLFLYKNCLTQINLCSNLELQFVSLVQNKLRKITLYVREEMNTKKKEDFRQEDFAVFYGQQSRQCIVQMMHNEKMASWRKIFEHAEYWKKKYGMNYSQLGCEYIFVAL